MNDTTREVLDVHQRILLWCWVFGVVVLLIWLAALLLLPGMIHSAHGSLFGMSDHELDVILYGGMGLFKILVITFFFIPWLSIKLVLRK